MIGGADVEPPAQSPLAPNDHTLNAPGLGGGLVSDDTSADGRDDQRQTLSQAIRETLLDSQVRHQRWQDGD
jgi:hypothetical protein